MRTWRGSRGVRESDGRPAGPYPPSGPPPSVRLSVRLSRVPLVRLASRLPNRLAGRLPDRLAGRPSLGMARRGSLKPAGHRAGGPASLLLANALPAVLAALLITLPVSSVRAQYFGQNKVQYRTFDWSVLKTEHFLLHFHSAEQEAAVDAGRMAERAYDRLSLILDHEIKEPIPLILYASQAEFQQTNVTPGMIGEGTGGFTEYIKRRVTIPLTGSYKDFDHVLTHELVHAFQIDILFGGGERSLTGNLRGTPPLWFMEGMAEYLSIGDIDPLTAMWVRDGALQGYLLPLDIMDYVSDIRVYRYGQAIVAYLGRTYGDQRIAEVFKRFPHERSLDRAFERTIGMKLSKFSEDWMEEMRRTYLPTIRDHRKPDDFAFRLTKAEGDRSSMNLTPTLSPDGNEMIYFSDRSMYNDLYLASALTGKTGRRLIKSERQSDFESLRFYRSAMDWSPDGKTVVFVAWSDGRDALHIQRTRDGRILRRLALPFDGLLSPSFSPDGRSIVFAGLRGGRSNLYRVGVDGQGLEQLTRGPYSAQEPRYSHDGNRIVFVSDRSEETDYEKLVFSEPRLALLDLATREVTVLPGQSGGNISPFFFPDGRHLIYVSDRTGIQNIYLRDLETGEDRRITDILTGVSGVTPSSPTLSLSRSGNRAVFSAFSMGTWDLFAIKDPLSLWDRAFPDPAPVEAAVAGRPQAPADSMTALSSGWPPDQGQVHPARPGSRLDSLLIALEAEEPVRPDSADRPGALEAPSGYGRAAGDERAGSDPPVAATAAVSGAGRDEGDVAPPSSMPAGTPGAWTTGPASPADTLTISRADSLMARVEPLAVLDDSTDFPPSPGRPSSHGGPTVPDQPVDISQVLSQRNNLPDPSTFEINPYRVRFGADYMATNGFFASNVGLAAQSVLRLSDLLGDHVILLGASVYGSFSDSDLLVSYVNLKHRTNWGVSAFQYRNAFYIFAAEDDDEFHDQVFRGVNFTVQRPFNRFHRLEAFVQVLGVSEEVYRESFSTGYSSLSRDDGFHVYAAPGLALVRDNTIYGPTGPMGGGRSRLSVESGLGDLSFRSYLADIRRYVNVRQNYALAGRLIAATGEGRDPQYYRIGGPATVRGYPYGEFRGTSIVVTNLEFRFPLIDHLRLGFPLPVSLGGVRGAFFFDAAAAWERGQGFRAFRTDGGWRLDDIHASYGLSAGLNVGFTVLKWDLAWRTDLRRTFGSPRGYFSFGLDY